MEHPVVSIVIPTYNRSDLLARALDSVVAQTENRWEIILVDDGSTDTTSVIADRYAGMLGDRFRYHYQSNAGASTARNVGIEIACGEYVAFLDSDDEFLPNKLERQLKLFETRPGLGLVYSDYAFIDLQGRRVESVFDTLCLEARQVPHERVEPTMCVCLESLFDSLLRKYFVSTITGLVRRRILGNIRWPAGVQYAEEWLFYLQVSRVCEAGFVDEPLCLHHHTTGSISRTDTSRNVHQRYLTICALREMFSDLSSEQDHVVRHHLAEAVLQISYDQAREGQWREAWVSMCRSLHYQPSLLRAYTLCRLVGSWLVDTCRKSERTDSTQLAANKNTHSQRSSFSGREGVSLW